MKYILVALACFAEVAFARQPTSKGMVQLLGGEKRYVEHFAALNGKPTVMLANGLTWSTVEWRDYVTALNDIDPELGIVLYDMEGMGQTIMQGKVPSRAITVEEQTIDLLALKKVLPIKGPVSLAGLSYGGAVGLDVLASAANEFQHIIAMAPFLARLTDQDKLINFWVERHRLMYPWDMRSTDDLYDFYLYALIHSTYPILEPQLAGNFKRIDGVYRLVQGAKNFRAKDLIAKFPKGKLHLIGAVDDEFVKDEELKELARSIQGKYASFVRVVRSTHKLPQVHPQLMAALTYQILTNHPDLQRGLDFIADPRTGEARSGSITVPLKKESLYRDVLRTAP